MLKDFKNNLISDFEDYLKENNYEISTIEIINENYINNYLMTIWSTIVENSETMIQAEELQNEFYDILNIYCDTNNIK